MENNFKIGQQVWPLCKSNYASDFISILINSQNIAAITDKGFFLGSDEQCSIYKYEDYNFFSSKTEAIDYVVSKLQECA